MPTLILDCDGVLAETERYGHLVAFNLMFAEEGSTMRWTDEEYSRLVGIGGGKERLRYMLEKHPEAANQYRKEEPGTFEEMIAAWHARKSEIFQCLVEKGTVPPRTGVKRLISAALDAGWQVAVASTSAEQSVEAVLRHAVGPTIASQVTVFAGDVVPSKKPAPDIYLYALEQLGADVDSTVVVEDSEVGLRAALAAGLKTIVTASTYTYDDDFSGAEIVVSNLGEPTSPARVLGPGLSMRKDTEIVVDLPLITYMTSDAGASLRTKPTD